MATRLLRMQAALVVAALALTGGSAWAQDEADDSEQQQRLLSGTAGLVGYTHQGRRHWHGDDDKDRGDARLYAPSIGFDLPTRAEQYARTGEQLRSARRAVREAEIERRRVRREQEQRLETRPEVREARRAVNDAADAVAEARREIDQELEEHPLYAGTLARAQELDRTIQAAHRRSDTERWQLIELAERRMFYSQRLDDLRQELADMTPVEEARQRLREAVDRREQVVAEAERELEDAEAVAEAEQRHEEAQGDYREAREEFAAARAAYWEADARQVAQYRIRRFRPVVSSHWGWGGGWWW